MRKTVYIPQGLWQFVGKSLLSLGYINDDSLNININNEPLIRWRLLNNAEWQEDCEQIKLMNFDFSVVKQEEMPIDIYLINVYVRETFRNKERIEHFADSQRQIILKGYIGYDNVILMNKDAIDTQFKETTEEIQKLGKSVNLTPDCCRLALFVKELISIYKFRIREFEKPLSDDGILENTIMLNFLESISIDSLNFQLSLSEQTAETELFEEKLRANIVKALDQKSPTIIYDNNNDPIVKFDVGKLFRIEDGNIHVNFGCFGLKTDGNLVGLGHMLYSPKFFGANDVNSVVNAWNWFIKEVHVGEDDLQMAFESSSLAMLLSTGVEPGKDISVFALIVDLYELDSMGIKTKPKLEEFGYQVRSHIRKYQDLITRKAWKAIIKADSLKDYLSNVSSECRLARTAKSYGFEIEFGKHPDLKINGKGIEVKSLSSYSLSNPIDEAMKQPHDIIAIDVKSLEWRPIPNRRSTWLGTDDLKKVLQTALACGNQGNVVLLFMHTIQGTEGRIILLKR